jgi:hypothetical protein
MSPLYALVKSTDFETERSAVGIYEIMVETVLEVLFPVIGSKVEPVIEAEL